MSPFFKRVAVPAPPPGGLQPLFDGLPAAEREAAIGEVFETLRAHYDGEIVYTHG